MTDDITSVIIDFQPKYRDVVDHLDCRNRPVNAVVSRVFETELIELRSLAQASPDSDNDECQYFMNDLALDRENLLSMRSTWRCKQVLESQVTQYPRSSGYTTGLVNLKSKQEVAMSDVTFLSILKSAFSNNAQYQWKLMSDSYKRRISFINVDETIHTIELYHEKDYWMLLYCIKLISESKCLNKKFCCECYVDDVATRAMDSKSKTANVFTKFVTFKSTSNSSSRGVLALLGSTITISRNLKLKSSINVDSTINEVSGECEVLSIDIFELSALALSLNPLAPEPYILHVSLDPDKRDQYSLQFSHAERLNLNLESAISNDVGDIDSQITITSESDVSELKKAKDFIQKNLIEFFPRLSDSPVNEYRLPSSSCADLVLPLTRNGKSNCFNKSKQYTEMMNDLKSLPFAVRVLRKHPQIIQKTLSNSNSILGFTRHKVQDNYIEISDDDVVGEKVIPYELLFQSTCFSAEGADASNNYTVTFSSFDAGGDEAEQSQLREYNAVTVHMILNNVYSGRGLRIFLKHTQDLSLPLTIDLIASSTMLYCEMMLLDQDNSNFDSNSASKTKSDLRIHSVKSALLPAVDSKLIIWNQEMVMEGIEHLNY